MKLDDQIKAKLSTTEPLTQRETTLMCLQSAGEYGMCGTSFLDMRIPRYAARISELRAEGYRIETRKCRNPHHSHRTHQIEYVLVAAHAESTIPMF